jgi:hypothetical protein
MKYLLLFFALLSGEIFSQENFYEVFNGKTMRIDYILAGDAEHSFAYFSQSIIAGEWTGSRKNFEEPYINGDYYFEIYDLEKERVLYSRSFNTLFGEWQTTSEAKNLQRAFQQSAFFPCPVNPFEFRVNKRDGRSTSGKLLKVTVDPGDFLLKQDTTQSDYVIIEEHAPANRAVDVLFIAEGYSHSEKEKFLSDARRFRDYMFSMEPYKSNRNKFNILATLSYSDVSGTDNPGISQWIKTPVETSFYTFGSERYLTTSEYWKIADLMMNIPSDQVVILVNTDKYGGGGIYNHYSIFSVDHPYSEIVFIHEFGHGFAGLGDEYYDSEVAYESFYDLDKEPLPPNLTTLVDFESKWKDMVEEDVPVPTPRRSEYMDKVGAFEGGGYVAKGIYRPQVHCRMKSNEAASFCKVCQDVIGNIIKYYSE